MVDTNLDFGFLRLPDVLKLVPVSKSTWWAGVKDGKFPQPVKIAPRCSAWRVKDIRALAEGLYLRDGDETEQGVPNNVAA